MRKHDGGLPLFVIRQRAITRHGIPPRHPLSKEGFRDLFRETANFFRYGLKSKPFRRSPLLSLPFPAKKPPRKNIGAVEICTRRRYRRRIYICKNICVRIAFLLTSGLYRRYRNFTDSGTRKPKFATSFADFTAGEEFHLAPKNILFDKIITLFKRLCQANKSSRLKIFFLNSS